MTHQEKGLATLVTVARQIVPPQLDFLVIVFRPEGDLCMSSAMYPSAIKTPAQQLDRAKQAAQAFLTEKPHPSFNPQN